ncbi:MAG TPA: inositol monophosphatase [Nanoarchaeota archaeon]|nr:MAG: myo-inositol-1(or 4)-monophosphatase [archaeon GW2011_AR6]MBS3083129.1 inositol monophosphatase [Candidatus Pacearchaeota archaeon]HIH17781.1 inositol monophosphatase [Nanoarchaeota archaeon]HIH34035.1 inositol monophosphatase [Nanoarchaeota archaeon]HIH51649.1 inositol monophosphatase [Nanoarchaeota archaeon]
MRSLNLDYACDFAVETARKAGEILMSNYNHVKIIDSSHSSDLTDLKTLADVDSDNLIRDAIARNFPDHNIISEEEKAKEVESEYTWVVDPLDGTIPYTYMTSDHFSVSIGLCRGKKPILGVIYAPLRNELYAALEGDGATLNGTPIKTSTLTEMSKAIIGAEYGHEKRTNTLDFHRKILIPEGVRYVLTLGCATLPLAFVASGKIHAYYSSHLEPWDLSAAAVINKEAGSKVTTLDGKVWELGDESILCANPTLHKNLMEFFKK